MVDRHLEKLGIFTQAHQSEISRIVKKFFFRSSGFMSMSPLILKAIGKFEISTESTETQHKALCHMVCLALLHSSTIYLRILNQLE